MSQFFRMPKAWHDSLDASLPMIYPIQFITGKRTPWIIKRLARVLETEHRISKWEFCKREGITMSDLKTALNDRKFGLMIWEDGGEVGKI